jgi:hypothetical protein
MPVGRRPQRYVGEAKSLTTIFDDAGIDALKSPYDVFQAKSLKTMFDDAGIDALKSPHDVFQSMYHTSGMCRCW